jgi:hypothetical protein
LWLTFRSLPAVQDLRMEFFDLILCIRTVRSDSRTGCAQKFLKQEKFV